jgi:hypothetical protein
MNQGLMAARPEDLGGPVIGRVVEQAGSLDDYNLEIYFEAEPRVGLLTIGEVFVMSKISCRSLTT